MADPTEATTKIRLDNPLQINGIKYPAGQSVEVPKSQADDMSRIDHEHNVYKENLMKKKNSTVNSGTIGVGDA